MVRILMTSRSDPARSHALSRRVLSVACDAKFRKCRTSIQSKNVYVTSRDKVRYQVHTLLLNQPKPPTMLPRRNDDDKGSISNFENETQLELLTIFLTTFFVRKKSRENGRNFGASR